MGVALTGFDKAIIAALIAAFGAFMTALQASSGAPGAKEYILAGLTGIAAGVAVYFKANKPAATAPGA